MASNSFKVLLQILGDSSGAVGAVGKVGAALERLGGNLQAATQAANQLGTRIGGAAQTAQSGLNRLVSSARQTANAVRQAFAGLGGKIAAPSLNLSGLAQLKPIQATLQVLRNTFDRLSAGAKKLGAAFASALAQAGRFTGINRILSAMSAAWGRATQAVQRYITSTGLASAFKLKLPSLSSIISSLSAFTASIKSASATIVGLAGKVAAFGTTAAKSFASVTSKVMGFAAALTSAAASGVSRLASGLTSGLTRFSGFLETLRAQMMNLNDVLRYSAQGITNLGRSLMFFISLPLGAFLGRITNQAIAFQDAMIRVQKTTGLAGEDLAWLSERIRELARNTATRHADLAGIAEVIGQMGVTSKEAIFNLTQIFEMFAVATDQTGAEVATALGRIANAFGWNLNAASEDVERLANVINELENTTAASASEIMTALADFAPFANMLGISTANAAGFAATLVSLGLSADEAGTALRNMSLYVARNAEEVSQAMQGFSDDYATADSVLQALGRDAVQVFLDILTAASQSNDQVLRMLTLMEIGDMRGGRGMAALAGNVQMLRDNLAAANNEWQRNLSLLVEYNRALTSTKSQLGMLKNNVTDLGITIGDALLPVINEIVQVAVPAIQMLAAAFKQLPKHTQLMVVGLTAAALLLGPVLMFLGQILHAVTLLFLGFGQFIRFLVFLTAGLGRLGGVIAGVGKLFLSWPGLVLAAAAGVLKALSMIGVNVAGFFKKLADKARSWGENLAKNIASGLLAGAVRFITQAISWIANLIASFFESHSPPKKGPLSTIDQWGKRLMQTFIDGFSSADFSVLEEIAGIIENILTAGLQDQALVGALRQLAKSRVKLAQLIEEFNQTGVINEDLLDEATKGLGDMAGKVKQLIRLQLRYKAIQERIAELEAKRKEVLRNYDDEIAAIGASNLSITDKVEAIRAARRERDDSLSGIDKEQEMLEQQAELLKEQLDTQKAMIDTLQKQEDIFTRIADLLKQIAEQKKGMDKGGLGGSGGGAGGLGSFAEGLGEVGGALEETQDKLKDAGEQVRAIIDRFSEGKQKLQGFLDAWNGLTPLPRQAFASDAIYESYMALYKFGQQAASVRNWLLGVAGTARQVWGDITSLFKGGVGGDLFAGLKDIDWQKLPVIGDFLQGLKAGFDPSVIEALKQGWETLKQGWQDFIAVFQDRNVQQVGQSIGWLLGVIARGVGWLLGFLLGGLGTLLGYLGAFIAWLWGWGFKIEAWAIQVGSAIIRFFIALPQNISNAIAGVKAWWDSLKATIAQKWNEIRQSVMDAWNGLKTGVSAAITSLKAAIVAKIAGIQTAIGRRWEEIQAEATQAWESVKAAIAEKVDALLEYFGVTEQIWQRWAQIWADIHIIASTVWQRIVTTVSRWLSLLVTTVTIWLTRLRSWWSAQWNAFVSVLTAIWSQATGIVHGALSSAYQSIVAVLTAAKAWWVGVWSSFLTFLALIWERIRSVVTTAASAVYTTAVQWFTNLRAKAAEIWSAILGTAQALWTSILSAITQKVQQVYQVVISKINEIKAWIGSQVQAFVQLASNLIQGFINGIHNAASSLVQAATGVVESMLSAVKRALGISSPSVIFFAMGKDLIQGLINGITSLTGTLTTVIQTLAQTITDTLKRLFGGGQKGNQGLDIDSMLPSEKDVQARTNAIQKAIDSFVSAITKAMESAGKAMLKAWDSAWVDIGKAVDRAKGAVKPFSKDVSAEFDQLTKDIDSKWKRVWDNLKNSVSSATNAINSAVNKMATTIQTAISSAERKLSSLANAFRSLKNYIDTATSSANNFRSKIDALNVGRVSSLQSAWNGVATAIRNAYSNLVSFVSKLSALNNTTVTVRLLAQGSSASLSMSGTQTTSDWSGTGTATPRASGGSTVAGQPYLVGELGAELFIPNQGGSIVPNHLLKRALLSGGLGNGVQIDTIQVNINHPVVRDEMDIKRLADAVAKELAEALNRRMRFGGNLPV